MGFNWWQAGQQDGYNHRGRNTPMSSEQYKEYRRGHEAGQKMIQREQYAVQQTQLRYEEVVRQTAINADLAYEQSMAEIERLHGSG